MFSALGNEQAKTWLSALKQNGVSIEASNGAVARAVASGKLFCGLTDSDDAIKHIRNNDNVKIVYLEKTLFIPNTIAIINGTKNETAAQMLVSFLCSAETERYLATSPAAQIPLNKNCKVKSTIKSPTETLPLLIDFNDVAKKNGDAKQFILNSFLK